MKKLTLDDVLEKQNYEVCESARCPSGNFLCNGHDFLNHDRSDRYTKYYGAQDDVLAKLDDLISKSSDFEYVNNIIDLKNEITSVTYKTCRKCRMIVCNSLFPAGNSWGL